MSGPYQAGEQHAHSGATVRTQSNEPFTPEQIAELERQARHIPDSIREDVGALAARWRAKRDPLVKQYDRLKESYDRLFVVYCREQNRIRQTQINRRLAGLSRSMRSVSHRLQYADREFNAGLALINRNLARLRKAANTLKPS